MQVDPLVGQEVGQRRREPGLAQATGTPGDDVHRWAGGLARHRGVGLLGGHALFAAASARRLTAGGSIGDGGKTHAPALH